LKEGGHVVAERVLLHFFEEGFEGCGLVGEFVVVPGGGGEGGKREGVCLIYAWIRGWTVDAVVEAEDLREEDDAVEVDAAKVGGEDGGAWGAVAFAEEIFGGVPAIVPGEEAADETLEGVAVGVDSVEGFALVLAEGAAEAGAGGVDEDYVATSRRE
jgi:hypothetical protein